MCESGGRGILVLFADALTFAGDCLQRIENLDTPLWRTQGGFPADRLSSLVRAGTDLGRVAPSAAKL